MRNPSKLRNIFNYKLNYNEVQVKFNIHLLHRTTNTSATQVPTLEINKRSEKIIPDKEPPPAPPLPEQVPTIHNEAKGNMSKVLEEITNFDFKKTPAKRRRTITSVRSPDIRHDLHQILVRRYSAMHSPMQVIDSHDDDEIWA